MTISSGDKVISIQTKTGPVMVYAEQVSAGDKVVSIKTKAGVIPVKVSPVNIGDKYVMVPDSRGIPVPLPVQAGNVTHCIAGTCSHQYETENTGYPFIYRTTDGVNWTKVFSTGINSPLSAFTCISQNGDCVIAGTSNPASLYRSTDEGLTWAIVAGTTLAGTDITWSDVTWLNKTTCFASVSCKDGGQYGEVWKSIDAGATWSLVLHITGAVNRIWKIRHLYGDEMVFACWTALYLSHDGGDTWTYKKISPAINGTARDIKYLGNKIVVMSVFDFFDEFNSTGYIFRSTDGGSTWASVNFTILYDTSLVFFDKIGKRTYFSFRNQTTWYSDDNMITAIRGGPATGAATAMCRAPSPQNFVFMHASGMGNPFYSQCVCSNITNDSSNYGNYN